MRKLFATALVGCLVTVGFGALPAWGQGATSDSEDPVTVRQSVDAFSTLEDAQPNAPNEFELELNLGWEKYGHDYNPFLLEPELNYTGSGNRFLENMQLQLGVPLELGEGEVDGNGDVVLGWQQRWVAEHDNIPTLGTMIELTLPTGVDSSGVDVTIMGILAKDAGPGTFYASLWNTFIGDSGDDEEDNVWGAQAGYKWRINEQWALIANYVHESSAEEDGDDGNFLEAAAEYKASGNLTVGPGIRVGLGNDDDQPDFGIGLRFTYAF